MVPTRMQLHSFFIQHLSNDFTCRIEAEGGKRLSTTISSLLPSTKCVMADPCSGGPLNFCRDFHCSLSFGQSGLRPKDRSSAKKI